MQQVELSLGCFGAPVHLSAPLSLAATLRDFFQLALDAGGQRSPSSRAAMRFQVLDEGDDLYALRLDGAALGSVAGIGALIRLLQETMVATALGAGDGIALQASAVGWGDSAILVTGEDEMAATMVAGWLVERGFSYLGQGRIGLAAEGLALSGFAGPFMVPSRSLKWLTRLESFRARPSVRVSEAVYVAPGREWGAPAGAQACALVIHAARLRGHDLRIDIADTDELVTRLVGAGQVDGRQQAARALVEAVPAISVRFDTPTAMTDVLDRFARTIVEDALTRPVVERQIASMGGGGHGARRPAYPVQPRTERQVDARLTIGMACYDDFDGAYFSLQAMRMYHPEVMDRVELLLIDNHPEGPSGAPLKAIDAKALNYRYIPSSETVGTAIREQIFREASGEFVLSMDCHVLFVPGALKVLLDYFEANPQTCDLIQGPILWEELNVVSSHWEPKWTEGMFGTWANDARANDPGAEPFEIPLQGLGVFACRKAAWPGFNPQFAGFGGEEGYIHEKFRQRGGRTLCLPAFRWLHRFARPLGVPYPISWGDRFRNYLLGWQELGLPTDDMIAHMRDYLGERFTAQLLAELVARGELGPLRHDVAGPGYARDMLEKPAFGRPGLTG